MKSQDLMLYTARGLGALWAGFWLWFGLASGIAEKLTVRGILVHTAVPGLFFAAMLLIAWRWETMGGILLIVAAAAIAAAYPMIFRRFSNIQMLPTIATLAGPPLAAGILFLMHRGTGIRA